MDQYHYIIGVATYPATSKKAGKFYMKYFIKYSKEVLEEIILVETMVRNKMWPTTYEEALKGTKHIKIINNFNGLLIAARINQTTLHHFITDFEVEEKFFSEIVELANKVESQKKLLDESKISFEF